MGKKPLNENQVKALRKLLADDKFHKKFELVLLNLSIDTMLRASDLLSLKLSDIFSDINSRVVKNSIRIKQKKTTKSTIDLPLSENTKKCIQDYFDCLRKPNEFVFAGQKSHYTQKPITIQQYARIVKSWIKLLGVENINDYSTHSLRKTKPTILYTQTGNIEAIRILLGHKTIASTSSYLGVSDNDATDLARQISV